MAEIEGIFTGEVKKEAKTITIRIDRELAERLERLNKGSYNASIKHLLGINPDNSIKIKVKEIGEEMEKLKDLIERVVSYNKLRY